MHSQNKAGTTVIGATRNKNFRQFIESVYHYWEENRPKLLEGDVQVLKKIISEHLSGTQVLSTLRTRFVLYLSDMYLERATTPTKESLRQLACSFFQIITAFLVSYCKPMAALLDPNYGLIESVFI